jgi:Domain of unknown function (DUF362)
MKPNNMRRRDFLAAGAIAAATGPISRLEALTGDHAPQLVQVTSDYVTRGRLVHRDLLAEMLDATLRHATGQTSSRAAWNSVLSKDDVIGLKFNKSGSVGLGTTGPFADAVITSLINSGFRADKIVAIEAPSSVFSTHGVRHAPTGWDAEPTDFKSGKDNLASLLGEVTAIVNIPFLKNHNIAGITCCLKNLSHALIQHPARFHGNHCSPYIADIVALPQIHKKLRLHLVNALRVVFDGGPEAYDVGTWDAGIVLGGKDPVALDILGLQLINHQRSILGLSEIRQDSAMLAYLRHAASLGLGTDDRFAAEVTKIRV